MAQDQAPASNDQAEIARLRRRRRRRSQARDVAPMLMIGGVLSIVILVLLLCVRKNMTMAECDKENQIPLLMMGLVTAVFAWLTPSPD
jgi:uncharacterized membrane protein